MSWIKQDVITPIPDSVQTALAPVSTLITSLGPLLSTISSALDVAKVFVVGTVDPFATLVSTSLTALEQLNNDLFGSGFFTLTVGPYDIEGVRRYDPVFKGFPLLTPAEAISAATSSFDDRGDANRPQFSTSATVTAFGLLATAPSLDEFQSLIQALLSVIAIPEWKFANRRITRVRSSVIPSVKPDWNSKRLNSIETFSQLQNDINDLIFTLRGYLAVADNNIGDLIAIIQKKVTKLQDILNRLNALITNISRISGIYTLDIPPTIGGNTYLKQQLHDSILESPCLRNGYTILSLFVGGGPSLLPVNTIRQVLF